MTAHESEVFACNDELREVLRRTAAALKADGPQFALAGSYALWAYGAPEPVHDVDFAVAEPDLEAAAKALDDAGFTIERTPEDWLFKGARRRRRRRCAAPDQRRAGRRGTDRFG